MSLTSQMADYVLKQHPSQAVVALERLAESDVIDRLSRGGIDSAAEILRRLSPLYAKAVLHGIDRQRAARMLNALPNDVAARLIRRADESIRPEILAHVDAPTALHLQAILPFDEGSAGALMDPTVLALPEELTVRDALQRIRKQPESVRYNLYVIDQDQKLEGAVNLRELLTGRASTRLSECMARDPFRLNAKADRSEVVSHPGWREVHALPVVDDANTYLGTIRYRVLRKLEEDLDAIRGVDMNMSESFGQLVSAGAMGVLEAIAGSPRGHRGGGDDA